MALDDLFDAELDAMPWADVLVWQRRQLPDYLKRLCERSVFYAQYFGDVNTKNIGRTGAWSNLRCMTKDDLRSGQSEPVVNARLGKLQSVSDQDISQVLSSSGTTGTPVYFGLTQNDRDAWAHSVANMWFTAGIRRGHAVALTTGMPMVAGGLPFADGIKRTGAALVWVGGQTPVRMVTTLEKLKVDVLIGTASFLTYFADKCSGVLGYPAANLSIRTVIGGGEPGTSQPDIRAKIKTSWDAQRVSEIMGICDVMAGLWAECPEGSGMHFTGARNVMVELIDPQTERPVEWESGIKAEAVYTTFTREATPVIRFRSRDHMQVLATRCACGRTSPLVRCIGRTDDMLIYKAMNVFPSAIRDVVLQTLTGYSTPAMRVRKRHADQVRFDDPIPLELELPEQLDAAARASTVEKIENTISDVLRVRVTVEVLDPGTIPISDYKNALTYVGSN